MISRRFVVVADHKLELLSDCLKHDPLDSNSLGLNRLDLLRETFTAFTEQEGLPNGVIYGILDDGHGHLWLNTINGLAKFSKATQQFRN